jgi:sugar (pentulose or hexulose) kinase
LAYAVVEGIALAVRRVLVRLTQAGLPFEELRVAGGSTRLDILGQVKADVLSRPVLHMDVDTASVGAALLAADAIGFEREARSAAHAACRRARRFEPTDWGSQMQERAKWFDSVAASAAVHLS